MSTKTVWTCDRCGFKWEMEFPVIHPHRWSVLPEGDKVQGGVPEARDVCGDCMDSYRSWWRGTA